MHNSDKHSLELMIDQWGVDQMLAAMSEICGEKAEHIRANWQDRSLAKLWDKRASVLMRAVCANP